MKKLLPILFILVACSNNDKDPEPTPQPSRTELLTAVSWKLTSVDGGEPGVVLTYKFSTDNKVKVTAPDISGTLSWSLLNDDQTLRLTSTSVDVSYTIVKLTADTFIFKDEQNKENVLKPL